MRGVDLRTHFTILALLLALAFAPKEYLSGRLKQIGHGLGENDPGFNMLEKKRKGAEELTLLRLFDEDPFGIDPSGIFSLKALPFRPSTPEQPSLEQPLDDDVCPVRCATTQISSAFDGSRLHPVRKIIRPHEGIDCAAPYGSPVFAAEDGRVAFSGRKGAYGRLIVIDHDSGWSTWYGHLSKVDQRIRKGAAVRAGQSIGRVGTSGAATGPHLHFETRMAGRPVNPLLATLANGPKTAEQALKPVAARSVSGQ